MPDEGLSYRSVSLFVRMFLVLVIAANGASYFSYKHEVFPFFSWALFQYVPQQHATQLAMRITRVGHKTLNPPLYTSEIGAATPGIRREQFISWENQLIAAVERDDENAVKGLSAALEGDIKEPVSYEIVEISYDTFERWRTGTTTVVKVLRKFSTEQSDI